ncbi:hypothetical protein ACJIZ3_024344 [Penstemon smallii]|uniref:Uncharacterized protein n=1 Tax=Penstemon smallii TaxID=265156 RepID=A0ABD3TTL5_9LAMI
MKPVVRIDEKKDKITIRTECGADEGKKHVEKVELKTRDVDTVKYVEKKLVDKGVGKMDRHPTDGLPLKHDPKKGHGGKFTWEGPGMDFEDAPAAIDDKDPNYVDEEDVAPPEVSELVVGEVEVAKVAEEGVARVEVDPHLNV